MQHNVNPSATFPKKSIQLLGLIDGPRKTIKKTTRLAVKFRKTLRHNGHDKVVGSKPAHINEAGDNLS